jgi:hypothetical protein
VICVTHLRLLSDSVGYEQIRDLAGPGGQSPAEQGFQARARGRALIALGCGDARKFIRFLAFGLTLCARRLTVTVRNHHY